MRNSGKQDRNEGPKGSETKGARENTLERDNNLDDDVDALFRLPLPEFTVARNALAARLKKSGRGDEAVLVKALGKPSISAWAVNQLYWNHRDAFDRLIASGERFHRAQTSRVAAKVVDMRAALDARREALEHLSDLATSVLQDAGHNQTLDTTRRITTTLEAISAMSNLASRSDVPRPGRLTHDVDPPGFESLASFVPGAAVTGSKKEPTRFTRSPNPADRSRKAAPDEDERELKETRKADIAAARVSLQNAKRSLTDARARAQGLEASKKAASAQAKEAEKHKRDAEKIFEEAKTASQDAASRARSVAIEAEEAAREVKDAERSVEKASKELESLFRESSGRS